MMMISNPKHSTPTTTTTTTTTIATTTAITTIVASLSQWAISYQLTPTIG
jgi:hypothetical protein